MLFNSYEFIFAFLPITFFIYFYLNHRRRTVTLKVLLIFLSLFFYSWQNIRYLAILLISILFNYLIGYSLNKHIGRKSILISGIILNIALLGYFKYADFFIENFNLITSSHIQLLHLTLPLGISFFTFQQISYLVDSYRGETREYNFLNYALFVSFFPQLIAGPIVHHREMIPQFASQWNLIKNYRNIATGLFIFSIGLFKKVIIADTFAVWATAGFDSATTLNLLEGWITSLSYTFQLYFDFSGYTDMAIGIALIFNIKLPINFNSPYKALNIQEFWRKWHITLSRFLKDYIYIPLGGNRKGDLRTYTNLMVTFIVGGFWHGAGWTFIFWGFLHGIALVIHRIWSKLGFKLWNWVAWLITFNFINIAWVFFRAREWSDAIKVLSSMFSLNIVLPSNLEAKLPLLKQYGVQFGEYLIDIEGSIWTIVMLFSIFTLILWFKNSTQIVNNLQLNYKTALWSSIAFMFAILSLNRVSEFLYFNF